MSQWLTNMDNATWESMAFVIHHYHIDDANKHTEQLVIIIVHDLTMLMMKNRHLSSQSWWSFWPSICHLTFTLDKYLRLVAGMFGAGAHSSSLGTHSSWFRYCLINIITNHLSVLTSNKRNCEYFTAASYVTADDNSTDAHSINKNTNMSINFEKADGWKVWRWSHLSADSLCIHARCKYIAYV